MKRHMFKEKLRGHSYSQGFTLIEVMVTVFILAVGLLGVAGIQAVGVKETKNSYFRSQADILVRDLAERMRANRFGAKPDIAVYTGSANNGYAYDGSDLTPVDCTSDCSANNLVSHDLAQWEQAIKDSGLPNGVGTVVWNDPIYTITVFWEEDRGSGASGRDCDPSDPNDMACSRLLLEF